MLEISNYILIYVFHISPKLIRLCRLQINTKLPVQFMIGGRKADQMGKNPCMLFTLERDRNAWEVLVKR